MDIRTLCATLLPLLLSVEGDGIILLPKDEKLCVENNVSTNVTFTCTLEDEGPLADVYFDAITTSNIKLHANRTDTIILRTNADSFFGQNLLFRIVNNMTASLTLSSLTTEYQNTRIECCLKSTCSKSSLLRVIEKPKAVEHMQCVLNDYDGDITCSWRLPALSSAFLVRKYWRYTEGNNEWTDWIADNGQNNTAMSMGNAPSKHFHPKAIEAKVAVMTDCGVINSIQHFMSDKIENFSCVVYDYRAYLKCSWDLPATMTNVSVQWKMCPQCPWLTFPNSHKKQFIWDSTYEGDFTQTFDAYQFKLSAMTENGHIVSDVFFVRTNSIVKPRPIDKESINIRYQSSTCVQFTWTRTRKEHLQRYQVSYTSEWNEEIKTEEIKDTDMFRRFVEETVCGLVPYTEYTFTFKVHPINDGFWSEETVVVITTDEDVPGASPELTDGAYRVGDRLDCTNGNNDRNVDIYWKPLKKIHTNGIITSMVLTFYPYDNGAVETLEVNNDTCNARKKLRCNTEYNFTVHAQTDKGKSNNPSFIRIPAAESVIPRPEFTVETTGGSGKYKYVYIEWEAMATTSRVTGYTVYWKAKPGSVCNMATSVNWVKVNRNAVDLEDNRYIKMLTLAHPLSCEFGVSMETIHGSSGLSWNTCIYSKRINATKWPADVKVSAGKHDNSLEVSWTKLPCDRDEPYIQYYIVQYCLTDTSTTCTDTVKSVDVPASQTSVTLTRLLSGAVYAVRVKGATNGGGFGPFSAPSTGIPVDKSLNSAEVVGIIIASLFCFLLVCVGFLFIMRYILVKAKQRFKPPAIDDIPIGICIDPFLQLPAGNSNKSQDRDRNDDSVYEPMYSTCEYKYTATEEENQKELQDQLQRPISQSTSYALSCLLEPSKVENTQLNQSCNNTTNEIHFFETKTINQVAGFIDQSDIALENVPNTPSEHNLGEENNLETMSPYISYRGYIPHNCYSRSFSIVSDDKPSSEPDTVCPNYVVCLQTVNDKQIDQTKATSTISNDQDYSDKNQASVVGNVQERVDHTETTILGSNIAIKEIVIDPNQDYVDQM